MKIKISLFLCIAFMTFSWAQNKNIFLSRSFWTPDTTIEEVTARIADGNDITAFDENSFDAVVKAIFGKAPLETIEFALSFKGNSIEKITHDKRTYLYWAAYSGNVALVEKLIKMKAAVDIKDSHQYSPMTFAAATGQVNQEIYKLLINAGLQVAKDKDGHGANALLLSLQHAKDFSLIDYFVSKGANLLDVDDAGNGAFNYASKGGNKKILDELISRGLPYKNLNKNGGNAMLFATTGSRKGYQSLEDFKYLVFLGVNANITNKEGVNPIHNLSYGNKDVETFSYFKSQGVAADKPDQKGNTPLMKATERNSLEVVSWLAEHSKNINHKNLERQTCFTNSLGNDIEVIKYLLDQKADIHAIDANGNNCAYYLIKSLNRRNTKQLKSKIELLSHRGFDFESTQKNGNTLFHLAVETNNSMVLKEFSEFEIAIDKKNAEGLTALHLAIMTAQNMEIINYLLSQGADKNIATDFDETCYELAKENELLKHQEINFLK